METYNRFTLEKRIKLEVLLSQGLSIKLIAQSLNYHPTSVRREIKKYSGIQYTGVLAHQCSQYIINKRREGKLKIEQSPLIKAYVLSSLKKKWAPQQISERMREDYPQDESMRISHESIYKFIYSMPKGELRSEIIKSLRQEKAARKKPPASKDCKIKIPDRTSIDLRSQEIEDRLIAGHWESDLLVGKEQKSALATLVERTTRFTLMVPLISRRPVDVREALTKALNEIPEFLRLTMTHDNGIEMMEHSLLTRDTRIKVFFAHPYSPWERGTNENTNMLIRQYFPKGTDFNTISQEQIKFVQDELNDRPRKVLNWRKPAEVFDEMIIKGKAGKLKYIEIL